MFRRGQHKEIDIATMIRMRDYLYHIPAGKTVFEDVPYTDHFFLR
jgi:hypothetical protein